GTADVVPTSTQPLIVGDLPASKGSEVTVLVYGHVDVQPPDPLELWESDPFTLEHRGDWLFGRGVVDDKGQLYMLVKAAAELAAADELPVNIRFACDAEEETGGHQIVDFLAADERGADAALIFDSGMTTRGLPEFAVATRGLVYFHLVVRTGGYDLHSGLFGGAALNANHALVQILSAVQQRDGRLPEPLRAGIVPPTEEERAACRQEGCRGVLPPHDGRALAGRERRGRRLARLAEDRPPGLGRGEPLDQAGARPGRRGGRRRGRAVAQGRGAGGRRARRPAALVGRGRARASRRTGREAGEGRVRGDDGPAAAACPLRRHAADRAGARRQGHPDGR